MVVQLGLQLNIFPDSSEMVFGIDKSFNAIHLAKKIQKNNLDYIVSDFVSTPFKNKKFDLIIGLNILELMEQIFY